MNVELIDRESGEATDISGFLLRLYAFRPRGHGVSTFMVVAESEAAARAAVQAYVQTVSYPEDYRDMTESHTIEVYGIGEVAENDND
jgi:hypothetical protein